MPMEKLNFYKKASKGTISFWKHRQKFQREEKHVNIQSWVTEMSYEHPIKGLF